MLENVFETLRPFIWPKYREEGPPSFVQSALLGQDLLGEPSGLNGHTGSVLELMTLGYRPVTSIAILSVLSDAAGVAMHGMQIGRELERRFKVQEGWFTRTRYYSDRVGKLLPLLVRLNMIREVAKKDVKGRREFVAYRIEPSVADSVRDRLGHLSKGERVSLFHTLPPSSQSPSLQMTVTNPKECVDCRTLVASAGARYCERCGKPLKVRCQKCNTSVGAIYDYCLNCGNPISLTV